MILFAGLRFFYAAKRATGSLRVLPKHASRCPRIMLQNKSDYSKNPLKPRNVMDMDELLWVSTSIFL